MAQNHHPYWQRTTRVVAQNHPNNPEQKKKERTITQVDLMPSEKQKACPHPSSLIVILPDNITICNHCYGLLDENLTLRMEGHSPVETVAA